MKVRRIGTRNYYQLKQTRKLIDLADTEGTTTICQGCVFYPDALSSCPDDRSGNLYCCDTDDEAEYIFVPATRKGLADYVAHKLEHS